MFEELGRHNKGVGHRSVLIVGLVISQLSMFFLSMYISYDFQRLEFLDYLKTLLPPDVFEAYLHGSIFDKTTFC